MKSKIEWTDEAERPEELRVRELIPARPPASEAERIRMLTSDEVVQLPDGSFQF